MAVIGEIAGTTEANPIVVTSWGEFVNNITTAHDDFTAYKENDIEDTNNSCNDIYIKFSDDPAIENKTIDFNLINPYGLDAIDVSGCIRNIKAHNSTAASKKGLIIHIDGNGWTLKNMVINDMIFYCSATSRVNQKYIGAVQSIKNLTFIDFIHKGVDICFDVGEIQDCKFVGSTTSEHDFFCGIPGASYSSITDNHSSNSDRTKDALCPHIFRHNSVNVLMVGRKANSLFGSGGYGNSNFVIPSKDEFIFNNIVIHVDSQQSDIDEGVTSKKTGFKWKWHDDGITSDYKANNDTSYENHTTSDGIPYANLIGYPFSLFYFGFSDGQQKIACGYGPCSSKIRIIFGKKSYQQTTEDKPRTVILQASDSCRYDIEYEKETEYENVIVLPSGTKGTSSSIVDRYPEWKAEDQNKFINNTLFVTRDKMTDIPFLQSYGFLAAK